MEDSEVVAAIAAGDPAGLAGAYDKYAAPLYGYCRWMMSEPAPAADALLETFVTAADHLGGLSDASQVRAWLYAAARDECYRRVRTAGAGFDESADEAGQRANGSRSAARTEVQRLIRAVLAELNPQEHEITELNLRHHLDEAELATVLEVSWSRAHALATRAREHLEKALDGLLIARTGRKNCPALDALLTGWDGRLTVQAAHLVARHVAECETCADHRHGTLRPEMLSGLLPLATLPPGLREPVLQRARTSMGKTSSRRRPIQRAASLPTGSQQAAGRLGWGRIRGNPGAATAVGAVTVWVAAAASATLITVSGMHSARVLADQTHRAMASTSAPAASRAGFASPTASSSRAPKHRRRPAPGTLAPSVVPQVQPSPAPSAKPTPSHSATSSKSPSSSPSASPTPTNSHTPTPTPSRSPSPSPKPA